MGSGKEIKPIGRGPFDQVLIEGFAGNKSAEEVSAMTGGALSPAQCLSRVQKIIKSTDVLTAQEKLALALEDAYYLRNRLKKQMEEASFIDKDSAAIWLKTLDAIVGRVEKASIGMTEMMLRFNERRAYEFVQALSFIAERMYPMLEERGVARADAEEIVLEAIPESLPEIQ